jgi:hypothetical protein
MKLTERSRDILKYRRAVRDLKADGFEEVGEGGGKIWELHRGWRYRHIITDVKIGPDGKSLYIKTAERVPQSQIEER